MPPSLFSPYSTRVGTQILLTDCIRAMPPSFSHRRLSHRRHGKAASVLFKSYACGPAARDGLHASVKTYTIVTMYIQWSKDGAFPATEAMECHWYRDGHIDSYHASLNFFAKLACGIAIAGEDGRPVTVLVAID